MVRADAVTGEIVAEVPAPGTMAQRWSDEPGLHQVLAEGVEPGSGIPVSGFPPSYSFAMGPAGSRAAMVCVGEDTGTGASESTCAYAS